MPRGRRHQLCHPKTEAMFAPRLLVSSRLAQAGLSNLARPAPNTGGMRPGVAPWRKRMTDITVAGRRHRPGGPTWHNSSIALGLAAGAIQIS